MVVEGMSQPSYAPTTKEKERGYACDEGEGQTNAQDGREGVGNGYKKGPRKSGQCPPKESFTPEMTIKSEGLDVHIQYMKYHALIAKFVGIWPQEKYLVGCINMTWRPKGGYDLNYGPKDFSQ